MVKTKKKFIDRKNAVTFHLVHRSQQDPLAADETAPQRVLVPAGERQRKPEKKDSNKKVKKEEQHKYGIYFDDDYDYLQHLREVQPQTLVWEPVAPFEKKKNNKKDSKVEVTEEKYTNERTQLNLPSSVFASEVEEKVGLLNKAAPHSGLRLDLDPEIIMAMDDDFDFEDPDNQLEDNFMELANAELSDIEDEEYEDYEDDSDFNYGGSDEENDEVPELNGFNDDAKSRFTEYSMSSSVMRRNQQLSLLDEKFEKMYAEYDENEIGALDMEEIEGYVENNSEVLKQCVDQFTEMNSRKKLTNESNGSLGVLEELSEEEELIPFEVSDPTEKWDCETILSTYSNLYNHPKLISEPRLPQKIKISAKTGIPLDTLGSKTTLTAKNLAQFDDFQKRAADGQSCAPSVISRLSQLSIRSKDESPEDRKNRKKNLREYRKERRVEKKANTLAFKEEKKRQEKIMLNNKNNVQMKV